MSLLLLHVTDTDTEERLLANLIAVFESCIVATLMGLLQFCYWTLFHCLGSTFEIKIWGNTTAILLYAALLRNLARKECIITFKRYCKHIANNFSINKSKTIFLFAKNNIDFVQYIVQNYARQ